MELLDNITKRLADDLKKSLTPGSFASIVAGSFSIYAFAALKKELASLAGFSFLFNSQAFTDTDSVNPEAMKAERNLFGADYETPLRNTLAQKALARECAEWISRKAQFRSNTSSGFMSGFIALPEIAYMPVPAFTTAELGLEKGDAAYYLISRFSGKPADQFGEVFSSIWTKTRPVTSAVQKRLEYAWRENPPDLVYYLAINAIFGEFFSGEDDFLPNEATGFKDSAIWSRLYDFQRDAALGLIQRLEKYDGCILADSVGLGKTFTALAVIKYYESRNRSVLVLCPKKIGDNWLAYKANYKNNPLAADRLRYDVLYHTDLSRASGISNGLDLERINWANYDLVVIDESHNFRNGGQIYAEAIKENRYSRLMRRVIRDGIKTRVLMLSATPVNTRFTDLKNQLALAYEGDESRWDGRFGASRGIREIFANAQKVFNSWQKSQDRSINSLLARLDMDFFTLLDSVTIARSRKHIEKYYNMAALGSFPERLPPLSLRPPLTDAPDITYSRIFSLLERLNLQIYSPSNFIFPSRMHKYAGGHANLTRSGRESGLRRLTAINLLKRLESSIHSFRLTLSRIKDLISSALDAVNSWEAVRAESNYEIDQSGEDFDLDDQNIDFLAESRKLNINLADMDYIGWRSHLEADLEILAQLENLIDSIGPDADKKLQALLDILRTKMNSPINSGNSKLLIFTAFADTAAYLYERVSALYPKTALITGAANGRTNVHGLKPDMLTILQNFSPVSRERPADAPARNIDILIATDCLSEGQNLQDCDFVINYDIHWNPVRIIQRFGRVDRLGSHNRHIQLASFWPDISLDEYINLKGRVEARMKAAVLASTGDDDLLDAREKGDLAYRKRQLEQLQQSIVDMEDLSDGLSIMDLGFNEYRQDMLAGVELYKDLQHVPWGVYAVVAATPECPPGAVFVLKRRKPSPDRNPLNPWYLVYVESDGSPFITCVNPQKCLQAMASLCKSATDPDPALCAAMNRETRNGRDMRAWTALLADAVNSIAGSREESDIASLFKPGGTSALENPVRNLDEFELVCFLAIKQKNKGSR